MAEKKVEKTKKSAYYKVSGSTLTRAKKNCPKCGAGVFLAEHKDRVSCGRCGFTEWKGGR